MKRRRQTADMPLETLSLSEFMQGLESHIGHVPCGSCRSCCYHPKVDVLDSDLASILVTEIRDDGRRYLKRKPDGSCIHLGNSGCTVYEVRPAACRVFDCRLYSALGIGIEFNRDRGAVQRPPTWLFRMASLTDAVWRIAGQIAAAACPPGADADIVLAYLSKNLDDIMNQAWNKLLLKGYQRLAKFRKPAHS